MIEAPRRHEQVLAFAAAMLPFLNLQRRPPLTTFWVEWAAMLLYAALATSILWRLRTQGRLGLPVQVPAAWLVLPGLAGLTLLQIGLGRVRNPTEAAIAVVWMAVAAQVWVAAIAARPAAADWLIAWCRGLWWAFWINAVAAVVHIAGWEFAEGTLMRAPLPERAIGLIGQSNHLGVLAALALVAAAWLHDAGRLGGRALLATLLASAAIVAMSGSRAALVVQAVTVGVAAWHLFVAHPPLRGLSRGRLAGAVGVFIVAQALWALWLAMHPTMSGATRTGGSGRASLFADGWHLFLAHAGLGVGWGGFPSARVGELSAPLREPNATHVHNLVLHALAEWGLVGGALVLAGVLWMLRAARPRGGAAASSSLLGAAVLFSLLAYSQFEHPLWFAYFLLAFFWIAGLCAEPATRAVATVKIPTRWMVGTLATAFAAVAVVLALDYRRIEAAAAPIYEALRKGPGAVRQTPIEDLGALAQQTLLPTYVEIMLARAMPFDTPFPDAQLQMAERAFRSIPSIETFPLYIVFDALAKGPDDAAAQALAMRRRNPDLYDAAAAYVAQAADMHPALMALHDQLQAASGKPGP